MTSPITFTVVIIRPSYSLVWPVPWDDREKKDSYWVDGRELYDNLYITETVNIKLDEAKNHAKDFLYRAVRDYQYQINIDNNHLHEHTISNYWNNLEDADNFYYHSGKSAECTWIVNSKVQKVSLTADVIERIDTDLTKQFNDFNESLRTHLAQLKEAQLKDKTLSN
jgi:hypothetical protein